MNYKFSNLLGAPYRGGNLVFHDADLLSAVGNRIAMVDLVGSTSATLPMESLKQLRTLALSPDGIQLLAIDEEGKSLIINKQRRVLLHHFSFKGPVAAASFSPNGKFIAAAVGRILQIWHAPSFAKSMNPMRLHRTYGGCHGDITCLNWSADSSWVAVASKDLCARVYSLQSIDGYKPPTLAGHRDVPVAVAFAGQAMHRAATAIGQAPPALITVSRDGALFYWEMLPEQSRTYAGGEWRLGERHFFNQRGASLTSAALHQGTCLLVTGFSNGLFQLHQLPDFNNLHTLSVSHEAINAVSWNARGDWLALGCASLGQLLVWEWRSQTYVLRQQGHFFDASALAFSSDGSLLATGADDNKVKMWAPATGMCYVTFSAHTAPVTAVAFLPNSGAVVSASLDGTVRAWDLLRYRNFRTLTTPSPVQFASLAVDPAGEVVCAGALDTFQIYVWAVKTGRLLDVLSGHEAPVAALAFSPVHSVLASASWDHTIHTWDVFSGKGGIEILQHDHDVLALAFRPDGKLLASATLNGQIYLWNPQEAELQGTIDGRRDIAGGRLSTSKRTAANAPSGTCFTSLAFCADGSWLLAGGASKYVCMYDVADRLLLRRIQISHNRSLDSILDVLNSRDITDAGPVGLIDDQDSDDDVLLPVTAAGRAAAEHDLPGTGARRKRPVIRCRAVALSPTGAAWAAATTEGILMHSLDPGLVFDPSDLAEDVTPAAVLTALKDRAHLKALCLALRLRQPDLISRAVLSTPMGEVQTVAAGVPSTALADMLTSLADLLTKEKLEPQIVAKATNVRNFKTGEFIEVLWQLEEDGVSKAKWWKAKVLGPSPRADPASAAAPYVIRYEQYQDIAEEEAEVIVLAPDQLRHADKEDVMKWRQAGDTSVPTESEWEEGRDDTVTLHELNEDGEELERDIGASIEDAVLQHLQENLPMDGQQRVMAGFRNFADFIKQHLRQKQADKGSEHVVTSDDVAEMLNAFRQNN
ncbi:hypothetical protein WJX73_010596 [Symbiochloris irregularis]|uniref:Small-subunit processome Utp12 domain-containing protein n=1 Tax=Symbiochloris irregularis TaxID=706552 RepID=A0AAW1PQD8_9CHLO